MIEKIDSTVKLCLILITSCLIFPSVGLAQVPSTKKESSYPPEFSSDYLKECRRSAQAQNISAPASLEYCSCTLSKIKETYSFEEIFQMNTQIEKSNKIPSSLDEIIAYCNQSLGKPKK